MSRKEDEIAQGIVGVRIIHDNEERLAGSHGLKAARDRIELRDNLDEFRKRNTACMSGSERGEQVEDVYFTGEFGRDARGTGRCVELKLCAGRA